VLIITLLLGFSNKFFGVNYTPAKQQSHLHERAETMGYKALLGFPQNKSDR
jgi:hypothetical protein